MTTEEQAQELDEMARETRALVAHFRASPNLSAQGDVPALAQEAEALEAGAAALRAQGASPCKVCATNQECV